MPSETFFNLSKEKQQRILSAARKEFSRASLNEASIANVIKEARIPRGSFYQYFQDKDDLYYYYFKTLRRDSHRFLIQVIQQNDGDVVKGFEAQFSHWIPAVFSGEDALFYKNLFMNMDYHGFHRVAPHIENQNSPEKRREEFKKDQKELLDSIDVSSLKIHQTEELQLLLQMLMHIGFTSIADGYRYQKLDGNYDVETAIKKYQLKLSWLKNGAGKEPDK